MWIPILTNLKRHIFTAPAFHAWKESADNCKSRAQVTLLFICLPNYIRWEVLLTFVIQSIHVISPPRSEVEFMVSVHGSPQLSPGIRARQAYYRGMAEMSWKGARSLTLSPFILLAKVIYPAACPWGLGQEHTWCTQAPPPCPPHSVLHPKVPVSTQAETPAGMTKLL